LLLLRLGRPTGHPTSRLTDIKIRDTHPARQDILLADGGNLFLRVRPSGSRGWNVRIKRAGKRRVHALGAWPGVTIKAALAEAARLAAIERGTAMFIDTMHLQHRLCQIDASRRNLHADASS
jgi:hypothetical protein